MSVGEQKVSDLGTNYQWWKLRLPWSVIHEVIYLSLSLIMLDFFMLPLEMTVWICQDFTWSSIQLLWICLINLVQNIIFGYHRQKYTRRFLLSLQFIIKCCFIPGLIVFLVYVISRVYRLFKFLTVLLGTSMRCKCFVGLLSMIFLNDMTPLAFFRSLDQSLKSSFVQSDIVMRWSLYRAFFAFHILWRKCLPIGIISTVWFSLPCKDSRSFYCTATFFNISLISSFHSCIFLLENWQESAYFLIPVQDWYSVISIFSQTWCCWILKIWSKNKFIFIYGSPRK